MYVVHVVCVRLFADCKAAVWVNNSCLMLSKVCQIVFLMRWFCEKRLQEHKKNFNDNNPNLQRQRYFAGEDKLRLPVDDDYCTTTDIN